MGISRGNITTNIIKSGLIFNMDAANRACYPRTGTTATDTVNSLTGIINGANFLTTDNGVFQFDGTDDYINVNPYASIFNSPTNFSINLAFNSSNFTSSGNPKLFTKGSNVGSNKALYTWDITAKQTGGDNNVRFLISDGADIAFFGNTTGNLSTNTWYIVCCTYTVGVGGVIYLNGITNQTITTNTGATPNTETGVLEIARENNGGGGSDYLTGKIGCIQYYNRALSSTEVLHNYNALKSRFE
tara:strand:+ start:557 stop:1288 length:732 start_codon:yes stop_codon:yes gene_type:complete